MELPGVLTLHIAIYLHAAGPQDGVPLDLDVAFDFGSGQYAGGTLRYPQVLDRLAAHLAATRTLVRSCGSRQRRQGAE